MPTGLPSSARHGGFAQCRGADPGQRAGAGANLLGEAGEAWAGLNRALDIANIGLAAELLGLSAEAFERTVAYLKERKQFGRVIGSFQGLQHRAAELFAELELARSIVLQALQRIDAASSNCRWCQCGQGQAV